MRERAEPRTHLGANREEEVLDRAHRLRRRRKGSSDGSKAAGNAGKARKAESGYWAPISTSEEYSKLSGRKNPRDSSSSNTKPMGLLQKMEAECPRQHRDQVRTYTVRKPKVVKGRRVNGRKQSTQKHLTKNST